MSSDIRIRPRRLATAVAVAVMLVGMLTINSAPRHAASAAAQDLARVASVYVGNADDDEFSGVVDVLALGVPPGGFPSAVDEDDGMAVGNVRDGAVDEVVIVDDDESTVHVHDGGTGASTGFSSSFNSEEDGLAVGNVSGDPYDDILVADEALGFVRIYSASGEVLRNVFTPLGFDANDRIISGDTNGDGRDEIIIANAGGDEGGRVDVFDELANKIDSVPTGFDGDDDIAVGDVTGDGFEDIVVANTEDDGRVDVLNVHENTGFDIESAYDNPNFPAESRDNLDVGDVTGDGTDDIVIANDEEKGRVDVIDLAGEGDTRLDSGYDHDDRFAVGAFGRGDIDADGIPDRVERNGIRDADGNVVLNLKDLGASPCDKDIVLEIDYMADTSGTKPHSHKPARNAIELARTALDNKERVRGVADCPYADAVHDGGINLITTTPFENFEEITPEQAALPLPGGFDTLKRDHFSPVLDPYVRYVVWIHQFSEDGVVQKRGGRAGPSSDDGDFVISLGDQQIDYDAAEQAALFLHELGHVMGLLHGGDVDTNCKPNYLSLMNYAFQEGPVNGGGGFELDFSPDKLTPDTGLREKSLVESTGIGGSVDRQTAWTNKAGRLTTGPATGPIDWTGDDADGDGDGDNDGEADNNGDGTPDGVAVNLNTQYKFPDVRVIIDCRETSETQTLTGFDDWTKLDTNLEPTHFDEDDAGNVELSPEQVVAMRAFWDQQTFPDTATQLEPPRAGFHGTSLGVATDAAHIYAVHQYRTVTIPSTSDRLGTLVMLDRKTMAVQAKIEVGHAPRAVAVNPVTNRVYVVNGGQRSFSLSVIDTVTHQEIAEVALGPVPVDVAVNTRLNRVYVSNPVQGEIQVIDGATNALLAPIPVGPGVLGLAVDEATGTLSMAMFRRGVPNEFAALGTVVDDGVSEPRVLPRVDLGNPLTQPLDVAVDPVARRIYVAGLGGGGVAPSVIVLDQLTRRELARIPTSGPSRAITLNARSGLVFMAGDAGVDVINPEQLRVIRHINAGIAFAVVTDTGTARQLYVGDFLDGKIRRLAYSSGEPR